MLFSAPKGVRLFVFPNGVFAPMTVPLPYGVPTSRERSVRRTDFGLSNTQSVSILESIFDVSKNESTLEDCNSRALGVKVIFSWQLDL